LKKFIFLIFLAIIGITACSANPEATLTPATPLPHSMKGYELYSWQVDDEWHFTLITGTNRLKTVEEITTGKGVIDPEGWVRISVSSVDSLKDTLAHLPAGEQIFWVGGWYLYFDILTLPPQEIIDEVQAYCQGLGLSLSVSE
jgi:hypothetical protein